MYYQISVLFFHIILIPRDIALNDESCNICVGLVIKH